jgi:hypothetical protein
LIEEYKNPMGGEVARLSHKHVMRLSETSREDKGGPVPERSGKINGRQQDE